MYFFFEKEMLYTLIFSLFSIFNKTIIKNFIYYIIDVTNYIHVMLDCKYFFSKIDNNFSIFLP